MTKRYLRGSSLICADKGSGTEKTYYLYNAHGDVVQLANEQGEVKKTYEYNSFGEEVKPEQKDENPFRYAGEYYDKETETIYLRARNYEPKTGRFTTADSYTGEENDPLSLHLYTYCENDGVNMVDPSGHDAMLLLKTDAGGITRQGHMALVFQVETSKLKRNKKVYKNLVGQKAGVYFYSLDGGGVSTSGDPAATQDTYVYLGRHAFNWTNIKFFMFLNKEIREETTYKYDKYLYFSGDFTKLKNYFRRDDLEQTIISYILLSYTYCRRAV